MTYMLLPGMKILKTLWENNFALPPQVAHLHSLRLRISTSGYIPKVNPYIYTSGNMYKNV